MDKEQENIGTLFAGTTEIDEDERKQYLASLGNLAHRYRIRQDLWEKMEVLTVEGAALYSFGIDPDTIRQELEHCGHEDNSLDELPRGFEERLRIIKSAVIAGSIKRGAPVNRNDVGCDDHTLIKKKSFEGWREKHHADWKPAEAIPAYPEYQPDYEPEQPHQQDELAGEQPFDPLRTDGVALIFSLDKDGTKNLSIWKDLAHYARRNGLISARVQKMGGKGQSLFDPMRVGDWLVGTGRLDRAGATRKVVWCPRPPSGRPVAARTALLVPAAARRASHPPRWGSPEGEVPSRQRRLFGVMDTGEDVTPV